MADTNEATPGDFSEAVEVVVSADGSPAAKMEMIHRLHTLTFPPPPSDDDEED